VCASFKPLLPLQVTLANPFVIEEPLLGPEQRPDAGARGPAELRQLGRDVGLCLPVLLPSLEKYLVDLCPLTAIQLDFLFEVINYPQAAVIAGPLGGQQARCHEVGKDTEHKVGGRKQRLSAARADAQAGRVLRG